MNSTNSAPEESDAWASQNEQLIKHLECLSGVLGELRQREQRSELPSWLRQGLREADHHLMAAQIALLALQEPLLESDEPKTH